MTNTRNPNNNSYLQALLDLKDCGGYGDMTLDRIIAKISGDKTLQKDLQAKWNSHAYPEKDMVYAQASITQAFMQLSPRACKVLLLLGCYCSQSTLIKVSYPVLETITGIKRTELRRATQELEDVGLIRIHTKPARHEPPIYSVDPAAINKGVRRVSKEKEYMAELVQGGFPKVRYWRDAFDPDLVIKCDSIRTKDADGSPIHYNALSLIPAAEAKKDPEPAGTSSGKRPKGRRSSRRQNSTGEGAAEVQIPGQMNVDDYPDFLPEGFFEFGDDL